MAVNNSTRN